MNETLKDELKYWREEAESLRVEIEGYRLHAKLCPTHFKNTDPWVRESALRDAEHYSALLYDKILKANAERELCYKANAEREIGYTRLRQELSEANIALTILREKLGGG